ncbi:hypothetical protein CK203_063588 [Vitis vinifera]|uniref:Uncharacterized protein n=1 Tax=Vitis vinifera TaxID=29760 RepID=A0A438G7Z1_VITVI|nr:hypothetical protein CK203_063588 [Vitis vinifera]
MASTAEKEGGGCLLGPVVGRGIGPTKPDDSFKARSAKAQFGVKSFGPPTGPIHETKAELSKLKGPSISARRKARSWPPSLKVSPSSPKHNLVGGGFAEANLAIFRGRPVSNKGVLPPGPETFQVFTSEIEGGDGFSHCGLANKVCPPFSASSEQGHPLARAFAPKSLPISSVSAIRPFWCQPFLRFRWSQSFLLRVFRFRFLLVVSLVVMLVCPSEGKARPQSQNLPLSRWKVFRLRASRLEDGQGQSVLESLRIRIVRDNGKGAEETKREIWDRRFVSSVWKGRSMEWAALPACGASGGLRDFNVIRRISEKLGDSRLTFNMRCFDEFMRECLQEALPRWTSDHSPICLETNPLKWGPTPFRFENMWLLHPEFKEKFSDWWQECTVEGWEGHKFMRKLKFVKSKLKDWNKVAFGDLREEKTHSFGLRKRFIGDKNLGSSGLKKGIAILSFSEWPMEGEIGSASWRVEGVDWVPFGESAVWLDKPFLKRRYEWQFSLNKEKPWSDGFTIAVYQECWDVIKEDLMRVFLEFHTNGIINQSTNATFIAWETHFGCLLIANEVVDEKRRSGEEGVVFKIDFEKAYDHVDWGFLDHVLERKGFSPKWRSWIRGCLSSSSFAILVNGNAKGWVKASRGLPLGGYPKTIGFWDLVVERISRSYFLSLFKIPSSIASKIESKGIFFGLGRGKGRKIILSDGMLFKRVVLSSLGLFSVKSFFLALSKVSNLILFLPAKFLWSSKAPSKVKALAWLGELFKRQDTLANLLPYFVMDGMAERNKRIFEDKGRTEEMLWDLILFFSSLWASCSAAFRGVPLSVLQLNWMRRVLQKFESVGFLLCF